MVKKGVGNKNINNHKISNKNLAWVIAVVVVIVVAWIIIINYSSLKFSPEEVTSLSYDELDSQVLSQISSGLGELGLVQLNNGELTPDGNFIVQSTLTFDTTQANQVEDLMQNIRNAESNQLTFQLATGLNGPSPPQTYQAYGIFAGAGAGGGKVSQLPPYCHCYIEEPKMLISSFCDIGGEAWPLGKGTDGKYIAGSGSNSGYNLPIDGAVPIIYDTEVECNSKKDCTYFNCGHFCVELLDALINSDAGQKLCQEKLNSAAKECEALGGTPSTLKYGAKSRVGGFCQRSDDKSIVDLAKNVCF